MNNTKTIITNWRLLATLFFLLLYGVESGFSQIIPEPGPRDKCPVCGMFVAYYSNWVATVVYQDQGSHHFDGTKDLFTFLLDIKKWSKDRDLENIQSINVKEYYGLKRIDAHVAFYVIGSDVLGPMGHELIPFATLEDAESFRRDHKGKKIYRFDDINKNVLAALKNGSFK